MNLFAISDLHLSFSSEKPMDVFRGWDNYTERISANWKRLITDDDVVIIPGDISWATDLKEAKSDFEYINSLPGKKIILKGNHDFWWSTVKKINEFLSENKFNSISVVHNSFYPLGKYAVCGTRGWLYDNSSQSDKKIILRECGRLEKSILDAENSGLIPIVFLHYPPVYSEYVCEEIFAILKSHGIKHVYYGHIHGYGFTNCVSEYDGIKLHLVSCDCIDFTPYYILNIKK